MDNEGCAHGYQQGVIPPHGISPLYVDPSGDSVPVSPQGETFENDFYVPFSVAPSNTSSSPGISSSIPFPENHVASPGGSSLMSRDDSRSDPTRFTEFPPLTTSMHAWTTQPHPHDPSLFFTLRPRSQTNPSFFPISAVGARSHPATHGLGSQMTPGDLNQPASVARRTSPSIFPAHPLPPQFASGPLHTHHNSFPGQWAMSLRPPPFRNQPSQPHMYYGHPLESSPYPPTQSFPLPGHQPLPYIQHRSSVEGSNPCYKQARHLPVPMPQSATSSPGLSRVGSYGTQQYVPPLYSPASHFGLPQQHQLNVYQWYYGPRSSANTFNKGVSTQVQQHYPVNNSRDQTQRLRKDFNEVRAQSTDSERLPSPSLNPSSKPTVVVASRSTIFPPAADPPERFSAQTSSKIDAHELSNRPAASTSRAHDRSPVRRYYHPNLPSNRSEWVMWVGNVPSDATHDELWQFLKCPAPLSPGCENSGGTEDSGVMSLFLISRSNCVFVNYQSEEHLNHAIAQFNGRKLRPQDRRCPRLVCRTRRKEDDLRAGVGAQRGMGVHKQYVKNLSKNGNEPTVEKTTLPKDRQSNPSTISDPPLASSASRDDETLRSDTGEGVNPKVPTGSSSSYASTTSSVFVRHFPKRFFILKSLTQYDLDLSVERGLWATQKHNEAILDQAFRTSKEVILIFSVNKSGEFYGYARMASDILRSSNSIPWAPRAEPSPTSSPSSRCVPAHGTPEQHRSRSRQSPQMYTLPSERQLVEASPSPLVPSSDETEHSPSATSSPQTESAQERWSAPGAKRKDGGADDPGLRLQPVAEWSGVQGVQPASTVIPSVATHGHSQVQQREASWGRTFKIKWLCTERIPFHRTRHLRNPWNHGREIKVSRDGTELEPAVGQQLVEEWPTFASETVDDDASTAGLAGRHAAKSLAMPGPTGQPKGAKEEPS